MPRLQLSIHGRDKNGLQIGGKYNPNPQPQAEATTPSGKRRRANRGPKKTPK